MSASLEEIERTLQTVKKNKVELENNIIDLISQFEEKNKGVTVGEIIITKGALSSCGPLQMVRLTVSLEWQ